MSSEYLIKRLLVLLFVFFATSIAILGLSARREALAQTSTSSDPIACLAEALTDYMNTVIDSGAGSLPNIRLLSPAFNLTSPYEPQLFSQMNTMGANFGALWGMSGNTYTVGGKRAMGHYRDNGWEAAFSGKPVIFTEYGDFETQNTRVGSPNRASLISSMTDDYQAALQGGIDSINYFSPLRSIQFNPEFIDRHELTEAELQQIVSSRPSASGINQGVPVSGGLVEDKAAELGMGWAVELITGPGELDAVVSSVNRQPGVQTVVRLCYGTSCGFSNPETLVEFLNQLNLRVSRPVYVIVGPNEPVSEPWVAPGCPVVDEAIRPREFQLAPIPCNETYESRGLNDGREFHSLRPYPASPCPPDEQGIPMAQMCGHTMYIRQNFNVSNTEHAYRCETISATEQRCYYRIDSEVQVRVDASKLELPIMGNTELVPNAIQSQSLIPFATRVNEYVSWYLNGTTSRAEEEDELVWTRDLENPDKSAEAKEKIDEVINLSGPIKKLLPAEIQHGRPFSFYSHLGGIPPIGILDHFYGGYFPGLRGQQVDNANTVRHNQIAVCTAVEGRVLGILGGTAVPAPCYTERDSGRLRLTSIQKYVSSDLIVNLFGLEVWLGKTNWYVPNPMYSYIPFSSTEDVQATLWLFPGGVSPFIDQETLRHEVENNNKPIYFPHMKESRELASILQRTYSPAGIETAQTSRYGSVWPEDIEWLDEPEYCEVIESRANPGDSLYADAWDESTEDRITGIVEYEAEFSCVHQVPSGEQLERCVIECLNQNPDSEEDLGPYCFQTCTESRCTQEIYSTFTVNTQTPMATEIWSRLVAGSMSVFRKMMPKTGPGTPVETIKDIPAESNLSFVANTQYANPVPPETTRGTAGDYALERPGTAGKVFFPHIGSVHEYFLQGIQKALRPKGTTFRSGGSTDPSSLVNCNQNIPDSEVAAINPNFLGSFKANFIDLANRWTGNSIGTDHAEECYNDVVVRSAAAGVNPIFTLTIWLNESGASNYAGSSGALWQDFGINVASVAPPQDFNAQIDAYLRIVSSQSPYSSSYPQCFDGRYSNLQNFMYIFHLGPARCTEDPRDRGLEYYSAIFGTNAASGASGSGPWNWVSRGCNVPQSPVDMSCRP